MAKTAASIAPNASQRVKRLRTPRARPRPVDHFLSELFPITPSDAPRQEQQVGRFLSIFKERLARRA